MISAGKLDRLLTLLTVARERTPSGAYRDVPVEAGRVWAHKRMGRGREFFEHAETQNDQAAEWVIRWQDGITTKMAVRDETDDGKIYDIQAVSDEFRNEGELHLYTLLRKA